MTKSMKNQAFPAPWTNATADDQWLSITTRALIFLGKAATLRQIYETIAQHPATQGRTERNWRGKVRQQLEIHPETFVRIGEGTWSFCSLYSASQVEEFDRKRRQRWPRRR